MMETSVVALALDIVKVSLPWLKTVPYSEASMVYFALVRVEERV